MSSFTLPGAGIGTPLPSILSKQLAPQYSAAAAELKKSGENYIPLAKVDATAETSIAEKYGVQGYPTLKFFINGSPIDYEGGRTSADIVAWILKKSGPPSIHLTSTDELNAYIEKSTTVPVFVYFGDSDDESEFLTFKQVAQGNDKVLFLHIFGSEAREAHNVRTKAVLFKSFDEKRNNYEAEFTASALEQFINANSNPVVLPFNDKAINVVFQQRNNALFLFTDDSETGTAAFESFAAAAGQFRDRYLSSPRR